MQLFLVPASAENIRCSIDQPVTESFLQAYLDENQMSEVKKAYKENESVYCWAMTEKSRSMFAKMEVGDIVLLCPKGTGIFSHKGSVVHMVMATKNFGDNLWCYTPSHPWTLVYFLRDIVRIKIDKRSLLNELGYDPGFPLQGVAVADDQRLRGLIDRYETIPNAVYALSQPA